MVLLTGEAGIGKSRIAAALITALRGQGPHQPSLSMLAVSCRQRAVAGSAQLVFAAGIVPDDTIDVRLDKLDALLVPVGASTAVVGAVGQLAGD